LALGFFGLAYYEENKDKLKLLGVDDGKDENGKAPVKPSHQTVADGTYQPLSRPIFIYVRKSAADKPQINQFVEFFLTEGGPLVQEVGFIALPDSVYGLALERFRKRVTGSIFGGKGSQVGVSLESLLKPGKGGP
ncbi:MAG TPA: substrate-binding domain-containing protein, partial [Nitrospiria bacterium]|nr:substrate-binding domain-containing protein [Nitrospiria bacterium]